MQPRLLIVATFSLAVACGGDDEPEGSLDAGSMVGTDAGGGSDDAGPSAASDAGPCTTCGDVCVDLMRFQAHCGACDNRCEDFERCVDGACACADGTTTCGMGTENDPNDCGAMGTRCDREQYCMGTACVCRPGFTADGDRCVDMRSDRDNCGMAAVQCRDATPVCEHGVCVGACTAGRMDCDSGCVDVMTDLLHCGRCGERCERDEVCAAGTCQRYRAARGCTACPCDDGCPTETLCCAFPGAAAILVCVDGTSCG